MNSGTTLSPLAHFLTDHVATWENDDLLISQKARDELRGCEPDAFAVLDWPALRETFAHIDKAANAAKDWTDKWRKWTVIGATIALVLTAGSTLLPTVLQWFAGLIAALLTVLTAVSIAYGMLLYRGGHSHWLHLRFKTERLRQFYFQYLTAECDRCAIAIDTPQTLSKLLAHRQAAFEHFLDSTLDDPAGFKSARENMDRDALSEAFWIDPSWAGKRPTYRGPGMEMLFDRLRKQRIEGQGKYVVKKTTGSIYSPRTRADVMNVASRIIGWLMLGLAFWVGLLLIHGASINSGFVVNLVATEAICGALVVGGRMALDTHGFAGDAGRYGWYLAAIESHETDYESARSVLEKHAALAAMERSSYRELRDFIHLHSRARPGIA